MEDIRIHIHDFGPLYEVEFQLAPMMIFTGMSSLGKSYANYLAYYTISSISDGLLERIVLPKINSDAKEQSIDITTEEISSMLHDEVETYMQSFLGDDNIKCNVDFYFGGEGLHSFKIKIDERVKKTEINKNSLSSFNVRRVDYIYNGKSEFFFTQNADIRSIIIFIVGTSICVQLFDSLLNYTPILPPARGAFVGENYSMKSKVSSSLGMYRQFLNDYDIGVQPSDKNSITREDFFKKALEKLLDGQLVNEKDKQFLRLSNGKQIALTAAASSIKELSPFLFYLKNHIGNYMSFCFEEPEAHLHPKMQVALADLVAASLHQNIFFQITTHSDYFLQRLNQLIKLGIIQKKDENKFKKICKEWNLDELCYIDEKDVKAYYFHRDDKGLVVIDPMPINEEGIPFCTFFEIASKLQQREDELNDVLFELSKKEGEE